MVQINFAQKEIQCKIVYYGPGMSGKTTNLELVHGKVPEQHRGELTSIATTSSPPWSASACRPAPAPTSSTRPRQRSSAARSSSASVPSSVKYSSVSISKSTPSARVACTRRGRALRW